MILGELFFTNRADSNYRRQHHRFHPLVINLVFITLPQCSAKVRTTNPTPPALKNYAAFSALCILHLPKRSASLA